MVEEEPEGGEVVVRERDVEHVAQEAPGGEDPAEGVEDRLGETKKEVVAQEEHRVVEERVAEPEVEPGERGGEQREWDVRLLDEDPRGHRQLLEQLDSEVRQLECVVEPRGEYGVVEDPVEEHEVAPEDPGVLEVQPVVEEVEEEVWRGERAVEDVEPELGSLEDETEA